MEYSYLKYIVIFINFLLSSSCIVHGSEICSSLNGIDRTCMYYLDCPPEIRDWLLTMPIPSYILKQLKGATCGDESSGKLCCPTPECYTWDGRPGVCLDYNQRIFGDDMSIRQLRLSRCKNKPPPSICYSHMPARQSGVCATDVSAFPPDPSYGCCGREQLNENVNRIVGGTATTINQYPWLAVIKYPEDIKNCSGVLISGKYVLTAAHCVDSMALHEKPYAVILGEHNKRTTNDCDYNRQCHNSTVTISIEDIIIHPDFDSTSPLRRHDIGLIRLEEMVTYTDYIQPICLPEITDITKAPPANFKLWAAGWGTVDAENHSPSDVKLKVEMPLVNPWECVKSFPRLWTSQLCAGDKSNRDVCNSDSGSPLMYDRDGTSELLGITSFGITKCGEDQTPVVYTKVHPYLSWIYSVIRP